jgi:hypothetical protein
MKRILLYIMIPVFILIAGCATKVPERKDFLFVPVHLAYFSSDSIDDLTFDPEKNTFANVPDSATAAFFKGSDSDKFKKVTCNPLHFLTTKKEEIKRFDPNAEDLLVMKAGFTEGYSYWMALLTSYMEYSYPNEYKKNIYFDINEIKGDSLETTFAVIAVNIGNKPINTLYIVDVMPPFIQLNGAIKYASKDDFLPLNVELSTVAGIEHKIVEKNGKKVFVYHILPEKDGIAPGHCVEIIVPVKLLKSDLMREQYKVKD